MSSPDGDSGQLSAGRLAYGCTNLATAWPHGGTGLGLVGDVHVFPQSQWKALPAEETNAAVELLWLGGNVVVSWTCQGWDNDAQAVVNPNTDQSSSQTVVKWPGSDVTAGAPVSTITNLVFTPWDTTNGRGFVIFKAAVVPDVNAQLAFAANRFLETPALAFAIPDGTDRLGAAGKFSELTL